MALYLALAAVCLVIALGGLGFGILAAGDPEGRAGNWCLAGILLGLLFAIAFVVMLGLALYRWVMP